MKGGAIMGTALYRMKVFHPSIPHPSSFGLLLNRREDHWRVVRNTDGEAGVVREAREAFYTGKIKPQSGSSYLHA